MSFVSLPFLLFFPAAAVVYRVLPARLRPGWLLLASYIFYMAWRPIHALLPAACTLAVYFGARAAERAVSLRGKRVLTAICAAVCLGIFIVFKYTGAVSVPVGISFFTFQALGYLVDVYRGRIRAEKDPVRCALFIAFFPQLAAGPIERAEELLPQMDGSARFDRLRTREGLLRMGWGFFLKLVIADRLAPAVAAVFSAGGSVSGLTAAAGAFLYALQIYCDFDGYCEIAVGSAAVLGVRLSENFRQPYFALGMTDYWRRWHITLGAWFRRYVYAPIAVSGPMRRLYRRLSGHFGRKTAARLAGIVPAAAVWLLTGLWHGAGWSFVLWGLWHGLFCVLESVGVIPAEKLKKTLPGRLLLRLYLAAVILPGAILFRAGSLPAAAAMLAALVRPGVMNVPGLTAAEWIAALAAVIVLLTVDMIREKHGPARIETASLPLRWAVYILLILAVVIFGVYGPGYDAAAFIYFRF